MYFTPLNGNTSKMYFVQVFLPAVFKVLLLFYKKQKKKPKPQQPCAWTICTTRNFQGSTSSQGLVQVQYFRDFLPASILSISELARCAPLLFPSERPLALPGCTAPLGLMRSTGRGGTSSHFPSFTLADSGTTPAHPSSPVLLSPFIQLLISPQQLRSGFPARSAARVVYGFVNMAVR